MIELKRIYEAAATDDGVRVLVDRVWPRGISKIKAHLDYWLKEVGPSTELRKWFNHEPEKFTEFKKRYQDELKDGAEREAFEQLVQLVKENEKVTLLYGAKDTKDNQAIVLKDLLEKRL